MRNVSPRNPQAPIRTDYSCNVALPSNLQLFAKPFNFATMPAREIWENQPKGLYLRFVWFPTSQRGERDRRNVVDTTWVQKAPRPFVANMFDSMFESSLRCGPLCHPSNFSLRPTSMDVWSMTTVIAEGQMLSCFRFAKLFDDFIMHRGQEGRQGQGRQG